MNNDFFGFQTINSYWTLCEMIWDDDKKCVITPPRVIAISNDREKLISIIDRYILESIDVSDMFDEENDETTDISVSIDWPEFPKECPNFIRIKEVVHISENRQWIQSQCLYISPARIKYV